MRSGAQQLIAQPVEAKLDELLGQHSDRRTDDGSAALVGNDHLPDLDLGTGLGTVIVKFPIVRSKTREPVTCWSALVPPCVRKTKSLEGALPWLYFKDLSSGEMRQTLKVLIVPEAKGLQASTVSRLKQIWGQDYRSWCD